MTTDTINSAATPTEKLRKMLLKALLFEGCKPNNEVVELLMVYRSESGLADTTLVQNVYHIIPSRVILGGHQLNLVIG
jgi:hypothetical protein